MAKKKKPVQEDEGPSQEWLASYADAMNLLLAFFIMMFAFALIDEGKFFDFKVGVVAALGVPDPLTDNTSSILSQGEGFLPEIAYQPRPPTEAEEERLEELERELADGVVTVENAEALRELLEKRFELAGAAEFVEVGIDERGVFIRFDGRVLFESASADIDDASFELLATAAAVLGTISNPLEVEGHTDNQPTAGTSWASNWELSGARSARVVRWLINPGSLPDTRLTALGKADTKPVASNNTAEGRRENRRVEIVTRVIQTAPTGTDEQATDSDPPDPGATDPDSVDDPTSEADGESSDETLASPDDLEGIITIDPIENPVGVFPQPVPDDEADVDGSEAPASP